MVYAYVIFVTPKHLQKSCFSYVDPNHSMKIVVSTDIHYTNWLFRVRGSIGSPRQMWSSFFFGYGLFVVQPAIGCSPYANGPHKIVPKPLQHTLW